MIELSNDERRFISQNVWPEDENPECAINDAITEWASIVGSIVEGYRLRPENYTNDLTARGYIQNIIIQMPQSIADRIRNEVKPMDEIFAAATIQIRTKLLHNFSDNDWWLRRIPRVIHSGMSGLFLTHIDEIIGDGQSYFVINDIPHSE